MTAVDERQPPSDMHAERCLLGSCLQSTRALDDASALVVADDFYRPLHGELFATMLSMREVGLEVDAVSLAHRLGPRLVAIGGAPYIAELLASPPTAANAGYYAEIIGDMATRRQVLRAGQRAQQIAYEAAEEAAEIVERARALFDDVAHITRRNEDVEDIGLATKSVMEELAEPETTVVPTGWRTIDDVLNGGLRPGTLTVIGARPSVGKSLVAGQLALNAALHGRGALFVSLEMTKFELICRMLSNMASIPLGNLMGHRLSAEEWKRAQQAHDRLDSIPFGISDNPYLGLTAIRSLARDRARTPRGLALIVVDYLGLVKPADTREDRRIQVDAISRGLKLMGKELAVPVVAAHQLNRGSEGRADKRPVLSDLRESGSIEQDADNVLLLYREPEDVMDPTKGRELEVIVAKQRQGPLRTVTLDWVPEFSRAVVPAAGF